MFRRERWDSVDPEDFVPEAPSAIEVISTGGQNTKLRKAQLYVAHGAEQVWIINPNTRTVEVLKQDGGNWEVRDGESVEFHGIEIGLSDLFSS